MSKKLIFIAFVITISAVLFFRLQPAKGLEVVEPIEIAYGLDPLQKFDLYYPNSSSSSKLKNVVINIHGGGWTIGDKRQFTLPMLRMKDLALELGYAVIAPNYRLAPANPFPAAVNDLHAVLEWIAANKTAYNLTGRYVVLGESAGSNLGAYISVDGYSDTNLKGFVGFAGYYKLDDEPDTSLIAGRMLLYVGCYPSQCLLKAKQASPYWNSMITPPMLFVHGNQDGFVSSTQSYTMASRNGLNNSEVMLIIGGAHTGPTMVSPTIDQKVTDFLHAVFLN